MSTVSNNQPSGKPANAPITAAFYLPQFHPIAENDAWWGEGFTEWSNVARTEPLFPGHYQPQVSATPFGNYDLLDPRVAAWQTELAAAYDVDAFIYYHYWFDGHRLLEKPLDAYLSSDGTHQFAICWANENWTRRWDGKDREVLISQNYSASTPKDVFESFVPYLSDSRYLTVNGARLLMVHRADHLPDPREFARVWRALAEEMGLGPLWLVASETHGMDPVALGFDAIAEFPPVGDSDLGTVLPRLPQGTAREFRGRMCSYEQLAEKYEDRAPSDFVRHPTVVPRWDNSPRRLHSATLYVGSSPERYGTWLADARERERIARGASGVVFINAWNEWAEGAYLEPDDRFGSSYLEATRWGYIPDDDLVSVDRPSATGRINLSGLARGFALSGRSAVQRRRSKVRGR